MSGSKKVLLPGQMTAFPYLSTALRLDETAGMVDFASRLMSMVHMICEQRYSLTFSFLIFFIESKRKLFLGEVVAF